jgi:LemA protein
MITTERVRRTMERAAEPGQRRPLAWLYTSSGPVVALGLPLLALCLVACGVDPVVQDVSKTINQAGGEGMSSGVSIVVAVVVLMLAPILIWAWLNNSLVSKEEATFSAWAQVESNYQRRSDLIPALVQAVSRYLRHEAATLTEVTQQRTSPAALEKAVLELSAAHEEATRHMEETSGAPPRDEEQLKELARTQELVGAGVKRLIAVAESYPNLQSADQFLELQAQLEGTENRINVARMKFNEAVREYNESIRKLPGNLVAGVSGLKRKAYFTADEGTREARPLAFD